MSEEDETIGDDGLTAREREFITTPVSKMSPEDARYGLAMKDKKSEFIQKENEKYRAEQEAKRKDRFNVEPQRADLTGQAHGQEKPEKAGRRGYEGGSEVRPGDGGAVLSDAQV